KESLTQSGDFTVSAPDGLATLTVGGTTVISGGVFTAASITTPLGNTLNVTGYNAATGVVTYTYTLTAAETHGTVQGENDLYENFTVVLTDTDGSTASSTLTAA
ncbi:hypothetical protein, partial [Hydrogenophaga sp. OTU3427]|uniref:hypothetical protein n=1 Tax=Hydrogenophaga sp. OTU3427 TaxID=3043856 RepID=UPI00313B8122